MGQGLLALRASLLCCADLADQRVECDGFNPNIRLQNELRLALSALLITKTSRLLAHPSTNLETRNKMSGAQNSSDPGSSLTSATAFSPSLEAIKFAAQMYNAAREGNKKVLEQAVQTGLPANLTNEKGDTLVS